MTVAKRRWAWPALFAACVLVSMLASIYLGQDVNWDFRNYHYYNAYAFLEGRLDWDIAPAQVQSYYNPLPDVPFYLMASSGVPAVLVAAAMALSTAIALFFLLRTLWRLFRSSPRHERQVYVAASAVIGFTGAAGLSVVGSTMNEWPCLALMFFAIDSIVRALTADGEEDRRAIPLAGLAAGFATGLKLSFGPYAAAFVLALATIGPIRVRAKRCASLAGFSLLGFAVSYGFWGITLARRFGSPFFPIFNSVFRSPFWEPTYFPDDRWVSTGLLKAIALPFLFATNHRLVAEVEFRDFRFAAVLALAMLCLVKRAWRRLEKAPGREPIDPAWGFLAAMAVAAYLVLMKGFGVYLRYLVLLELLSGAFVVVCLMYLFRGATTRSVAMALSCVALFAPTRKMDWGRVAFVGPYFHVSPPALPPRSLVILAGKEPMSYVIPFFRKDARFVASWNNFIEPGQTNLMARRLADVVAAHQGPLFSLEPREMSDETAHALFTESFRMTRDAASCVPIKSNIDGDALRVCRLERDPMEYVPSAAKP